MWPWVMGVLKRYVPVVTLPFAGVIGAIGYYAESWISDRYTPATAPVKEQRDDRLLELVETEGIVNRKKHNPLEVNLSPSLAS